MSQSTQEDDNDYFVFKSWSDEKKLENVMGYIRNLMRDRREDASQIQKLENQIAHLKTPAPKTNEKLSQNDIDRLSTDGPIKA